MKIGLKNKITTYKASKMSLFDFSGQNTWKILLRSSKPINMYSKTRKNGFFHENRP